MTFYNPYSIPNRIRRFFRHWYRRSRHLCLACGLTPEMKTQDSFALKYPHWCHYCAKLHQHASNYGMGKNRLAYLHYLHSIDRIY